MNRYASGYTLISVISVVGWAVVAISLFGGIIVGTNAPSGFGYFGWIVAISGAFQGIVLLGMGAIGRAVLDGSVALQEISSKGRDIRASNQSEKSKKVSAVQKQEVAEMVSVWDDVSKVEALASSGKIREAKVQANRILDPSQRAWSLVAIAEVQHEANDYSGAAMSAQEALIAAKSIEDKSELDIAFAAISSSVQKFLN